MHRMPNMWLAHKKQQSKCSHVCMFLADGLREKPAHEPCPCAMWSVHVGDGKFFAIFVANIRLPMLSEHQASSGTSMEVMLQSMLKLAKAI